jgi:hypothetical protein
MVQKWDNASFPKPGASTKIPAHIEDNSDGVDTAVTCNDGTLDPNNGWGSAQLGTMFHARGAISGASNTNPRLCLWQDLDGVGTYGWRILCLRYMKFLTAPTSITLSPAGPFAASQTWTALDLTTVLDGAGVQDNDAKAVTEVLLQAKVKTGASETLGQDNAYAAFRTTGGTNEVRVYANNVDRYEWRQFWLPLDSAESLDWSVTIGGGTASFSLTLELLGFMETV